MDIISYLLELIETRKTVGITALGTLYKKKTPGRYDAETHSFLPPKYEITFTEEIREDQELSNFISEKRNISTESAKYYISEFVENIQSQIADNQRADFSPLGELKRINNQLVLEVSETIQAGFDFYGLPSVTTHQKHLDDKEKTISTSEIEAENDHAHPSENLNQENTELKQNSNSNIEETVDEPANKQVVNDENSELKQSPHNNGKGKANQATDEQIVYDEISEINTFDTIPETEQVADQQLGHANEVSQQAQTSEQESTAVATENTEPVWQPSVIKRYEYDDDDDDDDENSGRGIRIFLKIVLALVIIAIVGALVYFFRPDLFNINRSDFSNDQIEASGSSVMTDTNSNHQTKKPSEADTTKKIVAFTNALKDTLKTEPLNETTVYEVIGSAMKTKKKVDEVISNFAKRGITAKRMEALPGRLIKISLGTFTDYNMAKKYQDSLKIKLKNPELYIQTIKPKN